MCHYTKSTDFLLYIYIFCLFKIYNVTNHDVVQSKLLQNLFNSQTHEKYSHSSDLITQNYTYSNGSFIDIAHLMILKFNAFSTENKNIKTYVGL